MSITDDDEGNMQVVTVRMPPQMIQDLDITVQHLRFKDRAEAIREAVRRFVKPDAR